MAGDSRPHSYTVHDRDDVKDRLDELDVDSVGEIRRAHGSFRHRLAQAQDAERLDLHAAGSPGQLTADFTALTHARSALAAQAARVDDLLAEARELTTPINDGHGPIARAMSAAFGERAGDAQGAVRALTEYRAELGRVLDAIQQTLDSYEQSELIAARRLTASEVSGA